MRAGLVGVVVIAGCGGKTPAAEPLDNDVTVVSGASKRVTSFPTVAAARPELDVEQLLPDFHEELRWPLSPMTHPTLEPRFDIAPVFAQAGIGWLELCERGVQNRVVAGRDRDELEYLRGWCSAIRGDVDKACSSLVPLTSSAVMGIPAAVRIDVANIIADHGGIDRAEHLLAAHNIRDLQIVDTLAATYVELGMLPDAYQINRRAIDSDLHPTAATQCRRLVRDMVLGGQGMRVRRLEELAAIVKTPKVPDATCLALYHAAQCWTDGAYGCADYFTDQGIDRKNTELLAAYRDWPRRPATYGTWLVIGERALHALPVPGAEALVRIAYDAALRGAPACEPDVVRALAAATATLTVQAFSDELVRCKRRS